MNEISDAVHQAINVDRTATECVITIRFSPNTTTNPDYPVTEAPDRKLLLRVNDAAERLSLSRTNIYQFLANGELESIKVGRSRLIATDSLEEFVRRYRNNRS